MDRQKSSINFDTKHGKSDACLQEQHLLYQLLADYFCQGMQLVVKPHPDDIAGMYTKNVSVGSDGAAVQCTV